MGTLSLSGRAGVVAVLAGVVVVLGPGCHPSPGANGTAPGSARSRAVVTCAASSVAHAAACPKRSVPPGNGSSPEGCKSDADCKVGHEGRCVSTGWSESPRPRSSLLAGPPPKPKRSECVYDACETDRECGADLRCWCRSGLPAERNLCILLDTCLSDRDCAEDSLCMCGQGGLPNVCGPGNCRSDDDCSDGLGCAVSDGGLRYCRTPRDACRTHADCTSPPNTGPAVCVYKPQSRAWECGLVPDVPAG